MRKFWPGLPPIRRQSFPISPASVKAAKLHKPSHGTEAICSVTSGRSPGQPLRLCAQIFFGADYTQLPSRGHVPVMSMTSVPPFSSAASGRFGADDNASGEMWAGVRVKHQGPSRTRLQLVADLNKIAIRIFEVNREDRPSRACPLGRSVDDLDAFALKVRDNGINWRLRQNAEVTASGRSTQCAARCARPAGLSCSHQSAATTCPVALHAATCPAHVHKSGASPLHLGHRERYDRERALA